jgi:hypothetical protein
MPVSPAAITLLVMMLLCAAVNMCTCAKPIGALPLSQFITKILCQAICFPHNRATRLIRDISFITGTVFKYNDLTKAQLSCDISHKKGNRTAMVMDKDPSIILLLKDVCCCCPAKQKQTSGTSDPG